MYLFGSFLIMLAGAGAIVAPYAMLMSLDRRTKVFPAIMGITVVCLFLATPAAIYFIFAALIPVIIMYRWHKNMPKGEVSWVPVAIAPMPALITAVVFFAAFSAEISAYISQNLDVIYSGAETIGGMQLPSRPEFEEIINYTLKRGPVLIFSTIAVVFYFTERFYYNPPVEKIFPMPDFFIALVVLFAICGAASFAFEQTPEIVGTIGFNGLICLAILYFFRGLDIIRFYFSKWKVSFFLTGLMYFLILISQPVIMAVAVLGFISVYKNLIRGGQDERKNL